LHRFANWLQINRTILIILAAALALRLLLFGILIGHFDRVAEPDTGSYVAIAQDWPVDLWSPSSSDLALTLVRTPGYPALIAAAGMYTPLILLIQIALSLLAILIAYRLTLALAGGFGAAIAAGILAFEPVSLAYDFLLLSEILFMATLLAAVALWIRGMLGGWTWMALAGLTFGLATLVRPVTLYLVIPLLVFSAVKLRHHHPTVPCAILLVAFLVPTGGWTVRNMVLTGHPVYTTIAALDLAYYRGAYALAFEEHVPISQADATIDAQVTATDPVTRADQAQRAGVQELIAHPWGAVAITVTGAGALLLGPGQAEWRVLLGVNSMNGFVKAAGFAISGGLFSLTLVGSVLAWRDRRWELLAMILVAVYLVVVSSGGESYSRMRVPLEPFMAILSAFAAVRIRHEIERPKHGPESSFVAPNPPRLGDNKVVEFGQPEQLAAPSRFRVAKVVLGLCWTEWAALASRFVGEVTRRSGAASHRSVNLRPAESYS